MTTKIERAKGKKALIALLLENGYTVNKFMFTDRKTGERYMAFKVYKYATRYLKTAPRAPAARTTPLFLFWKAVFRSSERNGYRPG